MLERRHSGARSQAASPESINTDPRNQWLGLCSWFPGPALTGRPGMTEGFPHPINEPQAEAVIATMQAGVAVADVATKGDIAELRAQIRALEPRMEAKLEALKADILERVIAMIRGALVVNIVAIFGAMFGTAKLLGH